MTDELGRLEDVNVRDVWAHEAHKFTPWLADNLDRLSEVIGVPLELVQREQRVGEFSADIHARNLHDDTSVIIENQLEDTDHAHLGQILTYLASVGAEMVIWIAPTFREPHLKAIEWLNESTVDPYRFFGVTVRAVRIGNSSVAPVFQVVARPNEWSRNVRDLTARTGMSEIGAIRLNFWSHYLARYPGEQKHGPASATSNRWVIIPEVDIVISLAIGRDGPIVFLRGRRGEPDSEVFARLKPRLDELLQQTNASVADGQNGHYVIRHYDGEAPPIQDEANWDAIADWLHDNQIQFENTVRRLLSEP